MKLSVIERLQKPEKGRFSVEIGCLNRYQAEKCRLGHFSAEIGLFKQK